MHEMHPCNEICGNDDSLALQRTNEAQENNQIAGSVLATDHRTALGMRPSPLHGKGSTGADSTTTIPSWLEEQETRRTRMGHDEHLPPRQQTGTRRHTRRLLRTPGQFSSLQQQASPRCAIQTVRNRSPQGCVWTGVSQ
jgi:hypothetical protein